MINKIKSPIKLMAMSGKRETAIMLNTMINNTMPHPHKKRMNSSFNHNAVPPYGKHFKKECIKPSPYTLLLYKIIENRGMFCL